MTTIDPRRLRTSQLEAEVGKAIHGAKNPDEAEERIREYFSPQPLVWVQGRGEEHFGVLIQPGPGADNQSFICKK